MEKVKSTLNRKKEDLEKKVAGIKYLKEQYENQNAMIDSLKSKQSNMEKARIRLKN